MDAKRPRNQTHHDKQSETIVEWIASSNLSFSQGGLTTALDDMTRSTKASALSWQDRKFWDAHSGTKCDDATLASGSAANAAARVLFNVSAFTAEEVASRMRLSSSTIRHYKSARKLYSYLINGKLAFPGWQFDEAGDKSIPFLDDVLAILPEDLHPQAVAGFFLTPQPDLVINGHPASAKEWLESGGKPASVVGLAEDLAAGY